MSKLLRADFSRLGKSGAFRLTVIGMLGLAVFFLVMQYTAMDYAVPLSRVVFLPLSVYGVAMAAFVSVFVGTDFGDGFIRNKLLTASNRDSVALSHLIVSGAACGAAYLVTVGFTGAVGLVLFPNNVGPELALFLLVGLGMSLVTGWLFAAVTLACGDKTRAMLWCVGLAVGMLFLALHTNSVLVQEAVKDGAPNPHYVGGLRRAVYAFLHDANPCGQAAQLTTWQVERPWRVLVLDCLLLPLTGALGCGLLRRKDIR